MPVPKEGEVFDKHGIPIYRGDLVRQFHFRGGPRNKKYWLYHVAVPKDGYLEMTPAIYLDPTQRNDGGRYWLNQDMGDRLEILDGYGPDPILSYEDRQRRKTNGR